MHVRVLLVIESGLAVVADRRMAGHVMSPILVATYVAPTNANLDCGLDGCEGPIGTQYLYRSSGSYRNCNEMP